VILMSIEPLIVYLALLPWLIGLALVVFAVLIAWRIARSLERIATALEVGERSARAG
jgi:hypothetical protein